MSCLLSPFAGFHWKGKIPAGFAGLHPPGATGAAAEDKPQAQQRKQLVLGCTKAPPGQGWVHVLAQAGLLSTVGLGQLVARGCAVSQHTACSYS